VMPAFALVALVLAAGGCGGDPPSPAASPKQPVVTTKPEPTTTVVEAVKAPDRTRAATPLAAPTIASRART
jgi:hypothetical protein